MGREKLEQSQGSPESRPRITVEHTLTASLDESGKPAFMFIDAEKKKAYSKKPITGVFIGQVMKMVSYSDELGKQGGQYFTSYYLSNKNIALFGPDKKGNVRFIIRGSADEVKGWIANNSTSPAKVRRVILLHTEKYGLIAVETNLTISIDQMKSFPKGTFKDYFMKLTPEIFSADDFNISAKAKEILGKVSVKNPPPYANIEQGPPLTDEIYEQMGVDPSADMFMTWRDYVTKEAEELEAVKPEDHGDQEQAVASEGTRMFDEGTKREIKTNPPVTDKEEEPEDDLPF